MRMSDASFFSAHSRYRLFAILGAVVTLLFVWDLTRLFALDTLFFFVVSLGFTLINLRWMLMKIELTPTGFTLHRPWQGPLHLDFRQVVAVHEEGRFVRAVSLVYYPVEPASGLVDMERPRSLFLPALERQDELVNVLRREMP